MTIRLTCDGAVARVLLDRPEKANALDSPLLDAALLPRLMGSGRAAWLVLTGEAIDARRACEWGLVEQVCPDIDTGVKDLVEKLLAGAPGALAVQKRLLHLWDEAPLDASVAESIEHFASCYSSNWLSSWMGKR